MPVDYVLVLGHGRLGAVEASIRCVKALGMTPFVVLDQKGADYSQLLHERLILRSSNVNRNHEALIDEIESRLGHLSEDADCSVAAIINFQDRMWLCYLDLCRRYSNAACLDPNIILRTSVKPNLRHLTRSTDMEVPIALLHVDELSGSHELRIPQLDAIRSQSEYLIVKPVIGAAGESVIKVRSRDTLSLVRAARRVLHFQKQVYSDRMSCPIFATGCVEVVNRYILIEQYLPGAEYSVEGVAGSNNGATRMLIQEKTIREEKPVFRDLEYTARHPTKINGIHESVEKLLAVVGYEPYPFHVELKADDTGVRPIEFNPRMGGGSIMKLVTTTLGVDMHRSAVMYILDKRATSRVFVTTVVQPTRIGRLLEYRGLAFVEQQDDCVFLAKLVPEGTVIKRNNKEIYLVEFCIVGRNEEAVRTRALTLKAQIEAVIV